MRSLGLLLTLLLLGPALAIAQAPAALLEDGPYVLWDGPKAKVLRVRQGKAQERPLPSTGMLPLDGLPALTLSARAPEAPPCEGPLPARIAAVSDIHGNLTGLVDLLEKHGIMDAKQRWSFGSGHLVVVGDIFDRGPGVTGCLWLLRSLQAQAPKAGGCVHVLLGNHEAMVLNGDLRYLNAQYQALPRLLGLDFTALYGPASDQGRWLRSQNILLRLGDLLFVHGGPSPDLAATAMELPALNAQFRRTFSQGKQAPLLGRTGPLWYRGLIPGASSDGDASEQQVTDILKAFHVKYLVIGHSTQERVTAFHQGRVFGIDANLQTAGRGELWLWEQGKAFRGLRDGSKLPL